MKNNLNKNMVKKILFASILLLFLISYVSAFCVVRGYVLDKDNNAVNASKINILCKRAAGDILAQERNMIGYAFPFGDWYDDCSYCNSGVYVNAFQNSDNLYGEATNNTCTSQRFKICHNNISLEQILELVSEKQYYNSVPDVGPYAPEQKPMPKGNETPMTNVPGIKEYFGENYTFYYILAGIALAFIAVLLIRKYVK